ncbi:hypothetical protein A2810_00750 [candidate division Kazan bacterium RIFCSPHIGHO2_01_FULL_49_10]|uniref:Uncharacterized protein n=1 Tax=candidate division Kazan bacterium RIFCSPLOWO2_01_FULL_48_13 TaxID=1798539 RepID=A0A1F4PP49_UNCK3|nr:MAG: hypothetical protein A2810_00750 [candidate division Kazan bacterium RIFCSPHIGHO2_01_FULL_49_10]OGB85424.1 MAG: hypothetical protein A2994_02275 [candidate division Kazan bacterium RIFCSPLOWO2_01_FULL_48_13]
MSNQSTSGTVETQPTSDGVARQLGRQVEDATRKYKGGTERAQLAMGHPNFSEEWYSFLSRLAEEQALRLPLIQRPTWKVLTRTCDDANSYTADLKAGGFRIGDWAADIMKKAGFKKGFDITTLELVIASGTELTSKERPTTAEIYEGIHNVNGELIPAWAGPELRKQYPDQPVGEVLIMAMETITASDGRPGVFSVGHADRVRWLYTRWARPGYRWDGDGRWVFLRRK